MPQDQTHAEDRNGAGRQARSRRSETIRCVSDAAETVPVLDLLRKIAVDEAVPRLVAANGVLTLTTEFERPVSDAERATFQVIVVQSTLHECVEFLEELTATGVSAKSICLGLFAGAARDLGESWDRDELNFLDVTIAMERLQALLRQFSEGRAAQPDDDRRVVLAGADGEQHFLGLMILADQFRDAGWSVAGGAHLSAGPELIAMVSKRSFDTVGLSAGSEGTARRLSGVIETVRETSRNPAIAILVGGAGFACHPGLSSEIGADGEAATPAEAIAAAERHLSASIDAEATRSAPAFRTERRQQRS
jgi:methanogenic corrinoid protein MtbC1